MHPHSLLITPHPPHRPIPLFFFNDTATTEIYTLSLHDALPISCWPAAGAGTTPWVPAAPGVAPTSAGRSAAPIVPTVKTPRSEEHTSELQSRRDLVCRLLLEKKKKKKK